MPLCVGVLLSLHHGALGWYVNCDWGNFCSNLLDFVREVIFGHLSSGLPTRSES